MNRQKAGKGNENARDEKEKDEGEADGLWLVPPAPKKKAEPP